MKLKKALLAVVFSVTPAMHGAGGEIRVTEELSLDKLLEQVEQGRRRDAELERVREAKFRADTARQAEMLTSARAARTVEENRSQDLERVFETNETRIADLKTKFEERLGTLKELFGVLQQVAGDARSQFERSPTEVQFPDRSEFLTALVHKMGQTSRLASIEDIERLWFELQREMTESGRVVRFPATVVTATGDEVFQKVTRVGVFNVVADGRYLNYVPETGRLVELARQPPARYLAQVATLESMDSGYSAFGLDPSRGQILSLFARAPSLRERIDQGGVVGYAIIGLGVFSLLFALERMLALGILHSRMRAQMRQPDSPGTNPLGRVLKVYHNNPDADIESMEFKLGEAILRETPRFSRRLTFLRMIAVVAPLLGLLGTVTGMIITFQAITLFGTGDPKLMAGGISQALVTTAMGLCVAIPTLLFHSIAHNLAKRLGQILEEQAAGMVAELSEHHNRIGGFPTDNGVASGPQPPRGV